MKNYKLDRRHFVGLMAVGVTTLAFGELYNQNKNGQWIGENIFSLMVDIIPQVEDLYKNGYTRLEIAESFLDSNQKLSQYEKSIIKKTLLIVDDISEKHFINILNNLKFLSITYTKMIERPNPYLRAYVSGNKIYYYSDETEAIDEKSLIGSIYILYDLKDAFKDNILSLLEANMSKYDVAYRYLFLNNNLSLDERNSLIPICEFLNSYADNNSFIYAVTKLRLLNISYNQYALEKDLLGLYAGGYTIYLFSKKNEHTMLHEAFHVINNGVSLLEEGISSLLSYEYENNEFYQATRYEYENPVIKGLCEILGPREIAKIYMNGVKTGDNDYDIFGIVPDRPTVKNSLMEINGDEDLANQCVNALEKFTGMIENENTFSISLKREINGYFEKYFYDKYGYDAYDDIIMAHYLNCNVLDTVFTGRDGYRVKKTYFCENKMQFDMIQYENGVSLPLDSVIERNRKTVSKVKQLN